MIPIIFKIGLIACVIFLTLLVIWYFKCVVKESYDRRIKKATSEEELIKLQEELYFKQHKVVNLQEAKEIHKQINKLNRQLQELQRKEKNE